MQECAWSAAAGVQALRAPGRMAAWRLHAYGPPAALRLDAARVPPLRAPDDVLVRVHAAGLNPLDLAMIGGYGARVLNAQRALSGADSLEFPLVTGRELVGEVERAGAAARLRPGQRVWAALPPHVPGAHADYVVVKDRWAGPAPAALGLEAGGALFAALSASAALRAAGVRGGARRGARGARVLVLGLGAVGQAALQLLVYEGAQVVVGCSADLCGEAMSLGAEVALDRHAADYDRALEDSGPYEAILDCAGLGGEEAAARRWRFRRYVTLSSPLLRLADAHGLPAGAARAAAALAAQCAAAARAPARAPTRASTPCPPPHVRWAYFAPSPSDVELLRRLADRGQWRVAVERVFPWWRADAALRRAAQGSPRGKLLLDFRADPPV